jgi:apolipoprotein N-acyltransferase
MAPTTEDRRQETGDRGQETENRKQETGGRRQKASGFACSGETVPLKLPELLLWPVVAAAALHVACISAATGFLVVVYLFALLQLARAETWRKAFYSGLAVGLLIGVVRLEFFWRIFSGGAIGLWLVFSFWIGLFVALARLCLRRIRSPWAWLPLPFIWCGLEYFRSELYPLRFSWLSPGFAFGAAPWHLPFSHAGAYGLGFLLMSLACAAAFLWRRSKIQSLAVLLLGLGALRLWGLAGGTAPAQPLTASVRVAGVQMEFPSEQEVLVRLNEVIRKHPEAELLVLSEYTFLEPVPEKIKDWCRAHRRHLIVGGKDPAPGNNFYNTAFVISPAGEIVFRQVKSVPIQFFKDGLPAPEQKLWDSPSGKLGICVCYDLSYSRVVDRLVNLGAEGLIVPTMDVFDWGERQHELHARVAPLRAAEYGLPIFRLASSGISQVVDRTGRVLAAAPCPGDGAILAGTLELRGPGRLPLDRWLAPFAIAVTALLVIWLLVTRDSRTGKTFDVGRSMLDVGRSPSNAEHQGNYEQLNIQRSTSNIQHRSSDTPVASATTCAPPVSPSS